VTAWDSVSLARHAARPRPLAYVQALVTGFEELAGDRLVIEDPELVGGVGLVAGERAMVLACRHGPSGFGAGGLRKAMRLVHLAERFDLAVVSFVDVAGQHPTSSPHGPMWPAVGAALECFMEAAVPTISVLTGEGVSGGALALSVSDRLIALEHAFLAPNSPEAVSAILWRDAARAPDAAAMMRLTSADLVQLGLCTRVVPEGRGAHQDAAKVIADTGEALRAELALARAVPASERLSRRAARFRGVAW
jgi:acetyl-CoA carboxylase carboxyl transferase subunit alpha